MSIEKCGSSALAASSISPPLMSFNARSQSIAEDRNVQAIVLRLNNVYHMDASMCLAILRLYETLKSTAAISSSAA